jgi:hypothetical protein
MDVQLWHPHGHGAQPLYNITATFTPNSSSRTQPFNHDHNNHDETNGDGVGLTAVAPAASATTTRRIGFRHVALVTVNDTDPSVLRAFGGSGSAGAAGGTGQLTMFFRVNGAAVYARGGNKVPMDLIDG